MHQIIFKHFLRLTPEDPRFLLWPCEAPKRTSAPGARPQLRTTQWRLFWREISLSWRTGLPARCSVADWLTGGRQYIHQTITFIRTGLLATADIARWVLWTVHLDIRLAPFFASSSSSLSSPSFFNHCVTVISRFCVNLFVSDNRI